MQQLIAPPRRLTKKEKRALKLQGRPPQQNNGLQSMKGVQPLTLNQARAFDGYKKGKNLLLHGTAGTGKTFIGMYLGLRSVLEGEADRVIIVRSTVPSRDMGFLPGSDKDKIKVYESVYSAICSELFQRGDAYDILKQKKQLEFVSTAFLRGTTLRNCIVIVDEIQNMNWPELSTIMTRIGEGCRVVLCGDTKQSDLTEREGKTHILKLLDVCQSMDSFTFVQMAVRDIVRSGFVKDFIVACEKLGY